MAPEYVERVRQRLGQKLKDGKHSGIGIPPEKQAAIPKLSPRPTAPRLAATAALVSA